MSTAARLPARYLAGSYLARLAEEGMAVAVALIALSRLGEVGTAAILMAAWLVPHIVAAPVVGAVSVRFVRPARFYASVLVVFSVAIGALTTMIGYWPLWMTIVVALIGGSCGPVVAGGLSSMVADMLPEPNRDRGYALDSATYNAASVTGPALAAGVAVVAPPAVGGYLLAGSAAIGAVLIVGLARASTTADTPSAGMWRLVSAGIVTVWRRPVLRAVTAATCVAYLGLGALTVTAVKLAERWEDPALGGALMTCFSVGAVLGALAVARWPPRMAPERLALICLIVTGAGLALTVWVPWFPVAAVMFSLAGIGDGPLLSATFQVRAAHTTRGDRTQVFTTGAALKLTAAALGSALVGVLPVSATMFLTAIALTQFAAAGLLWVALPRTAPTPTPAMDKVVLSITGPSQG